MSRFVRKFLHSSPNACCVAEVGHAKAELAVWDWAPKPRYLVDTAPSAPECYYFLLACDADDAYAVEEVSRNAHKAWSVTVCATSSLLMAPDPAIDGVVSELLKNVRHVLFSACDGDAAIVWTPSTSGSGSLSVEPRDAMDSRQRPD